MGTNNEIKDFEAEFFECDCHSDEHTLKFTWDEEDNQIYTSVYLCDWQGFWKRLWVGIKYIFGYNSRYGHWDCFLLKTKDAPRLKAMLDKMIDETEEEKAIRMEKYWNTPKAKY